MKYPLLSLTMMFAPLFCHAQHFLWGTHYIQHFNAIASGLPVGWEVDTAATATQKGFPAVYDPTPTGWASPSTTAGKFKNFASASGHPVSAGFTTAMQAADTDRALGVRQVAASDAGVAFVFRIDNTVGLSGFQLSVRLQSLDSLSQRTAKWRIDCASGVSPVLWTKAPLQWGDSTTGGNTYSDSVLGASFGTMLDNLAGPVWIRIVTLTPTTGANSRPTTAIDSFVLQWSGYATGPFRPTVTSLTPPGGSSLVALSTPLSLTFNRHVDTGGGNIYLKNETAGTTQVIPCIPGNVTINGHTAILNTAVLAEGSHYHVSFDSTAFDTAHFKAAGLYDTSLWRFRTIPAVVDVQSIQENFDSACIPPGWYAWSAQGPGEWTCNAPPGSTRFVQIRGATGLPALNEDWLVTPRIIPAGTTELQFSIRSQGDGPLPDVLQSGDYIGYGDPGAANWLSVPVNFSADTGVWRKAGALYYPSGPHFLAIRYISTDSNGHTIQLDSFVVDRGTRLPQTPENPGAWSAYWHAQEIILLAPADFNGRASCTLHDLSGRKLTGSAVLLSPNDRTARIPAPLLPGLYLLRIGTDTGARTVRVLVR